MALQVHMKEAQRARPLQVVEEVIVEQEPRRKRQSPVAEKPVRKTGAVGETQE